MDYIKRILVVVIAITIAIVLLVLFFHIFIFVILFGILIYLIYKVYKTFFKKETPRPKKNIRINTVIMDAEYKEKKRD